MGRPASASGSVDESYVTRVISSGGTVRKNPDVADHVGSGFCRVRPAHYAQAIHEPVQQSDLEARNREAEHDRRNASGPR
jgi:hypothetical protein